MANPSDSPLDRDRFYGEMPSEESLSKKRAEAASLASDDDADEYELEEIDQSVLDHERERGEAELKKAESAVDVDRLYREMDSAADWDGLAGKVRAQFGIKHLLILMTVVAVVLGMWQAGLFSSGAAFAFLIFLTLLGLGLTHAYINLKERRKQEELYASHRLQLLKSRQAAGEELDIDEEDFLPSKISPLDEFMQFVLPLRKFSAAEFFIALPIASVIAIPLAILGSTFQAISGLGILALTALAIQASGGEVPKVLILAWWFAVIAYVVISVAMAGLSMLA